MVNYLTAIGIQQVSITIASGSTTGTATITGVGSGAFILFQGINPSDTANLNDTNCRVELTNSTTVTATRGATGTSQTVVVNAVVIDGDTTNLIKSVQSGTVTIASTATSGTASISAVTNANTAIAWLGQSVVTSTTAESQVKSVISLSGTTVTANRVNQNSFAVIVGFCVIEFQGSALNSSVQNIAYNATANVSTVNVTVSSVTTANSMLIHGGWGGGASGNGNQQFPFYKLTNSTTFTSTWNSAISIARRYNACLVEFASGVLAQSVQRGQISLAAATSNTATITSSPTSSTVCNWLGNSTSSTVVSPAVSEYKAAQTNATTITMTSNASATGTGSYEAVQFQPFIAPSTGGIYIGDWFG